MPKRVEIEFPAAFDSDAAQPIQLGRLSLGSHLGRLIFTPAGKLVLIVQQSSVTDGSVIIMPDPDPNDMAFDFGRAKGT